MKYLFQEIVDRRPDNYGPYLTACENSKGVLDVDTVKGCELGMKAYPKGGCYGECYAAKTAKMYGYDFTKSVSRKPYKLHFAKVFEAVKKFPASWYRIGTAGDPSHDWDNTVEVCVKLISTGKNPVIITKHWIAASDKHLIALKDCGASFNTSTSGFDTDEEIEYRVSQIKRIASFGIKSVNRIVTAKYGDTEWGRQAQKKQDYLFTIQPIIDNPLRIPTTSERVRNGDVIVEKIQRAIGGGKMISLHAKGVFLGHCSLCPDQCGAVNGARIEHEFQVEHGQLFATVNP